MKAHRIKPRDPNRLPLEADEIEIVGGTKLKIGDKIYAKYLNSWRYAKEDVSYFAGKSSCDIHKDYDNSLRFSRKKK